MSETTAGSATPQERKTAASAADTAAATTAFGVILAVSFCHMLNDTMQSLFSAIYPILQQQYSLSLSQIGMLTLTFQVTASILQPLIGLMADKRPMPFSTAIGMSFTMLGLLILSTAHLYNSLLIGAASIGLGSAVFHPESSRVARLASGGRHGLSQSLFQVGGNVGSSIGPLLAAFVVLPHGQKSLAWFSGVALLAGLVLWRVGIWYKHHSATRAGQKAIRQGPPLSRQKTLIALTILAVLVFTKYIYMSSLTNYYTFYLIHKFGVSVEQAQLLLFVFLGALAVGTIVGGPIGDKIGSRNVIWLSILGVLPFTIALPYVNLPCTAILTAVIGVILASAFPAIIVLAQELAPARVGMIAGLFFGFAFGTAGIAAAVLGKVADIEGIRFVYVFCSFLPALGLLTVFLPSMKELRGSER